MVVGQAVAILLVAGGVALRPQAGNWDVPLLVLLVAFAVMSDLAGVETSSAKLRVSGSFLAIVAAVIILGGVPGAIVGEATIIVGWLGSREAGHYFRNNLVTYAIFPIVSGAVFHSIATQASLTDENVGYYLLVFAVFGLALALNFVLVAGYQCVLDGTSLRSKVGEALVPLIASELASALLCVCTVYLFARAGFGGVAMLGIVILVFQLLVGQLLLSQQRGERLHRQAVSDPLTGLANRTLLHERLDAEIAAGRPYGLLLMDLDGFKEVNDALGHDCGDQLLIAIAERLSDVIGDRGLIARLGGDEFAVLLENERSPPALRGLADELHAALEQSVPVGEMTLETSASIGIVRYPEDGTTSQLLLRRADVAMYAAKAAGGSSEFYAPGRDPHTPRRLQLLSDLRRGIKGGEMVLEFQPEVNLGKRGVRAAEALVRWDHPALGRLSPADFVQLAEHSGLIKPLTEEVLDIALAQAAEWRKQGLELQIAVNLSARTLGDRRLADQITRQIANAGLTPDALALEITETMVLQDPARALASLDRLRAMGVELSIDDFGTGYSSLAYLKRLPLNEVKVDRSFVSSMMTDSVDAVIVRSTVDLAHSLGLRAVAEGVEDADTLERLGELGCDVAQGFHLSRPLPPKDLFDWAIREADRRWTVAGGAGEDSVQPVIAPPHLVTPPVPAIITPGSAPPVPERVALPRARSRG